MSIIGLDFGSHSSSLAIFNCDNDTIEVFTDDMGSRCIPCVVAFRGDEILVGQGASSQQYRNGANTFNDLRNIMERMARGNYDDQYVPAIDKSIPPAEIISLYFRHIHNQVKQQAGKVVRDVVVTVPTQADESYKTNLKAAAKAGGMRIQAFIPDSWCALLAHKFDSELNKKVVMIIDLGWSKCEISCYDIRSGVLFPVASRLSTDICGKLIVDSVVDHCTKDFQRKYKMPCTDNNRAMTRLRLECENVVKILSTAAEASIGIDSLHEGVDYCGRLTRARFEDINSALFMKFKKLVEDTLMDCTAALPSELITDVVVAGGFSSIPKIQSIATSTLSGASIVRNRVDPTEVLCLGACRHGVLLQQESALADEVARCPPDLPCCSEDIYICSPDENIADDDTQSQDASRLVVVEAGALLPYQRTFSLSTTSETCYFAVRTGPSGRHLGQVVVHIPVSDDSSHIRLNVCMDSSGTLTIEVFSGSALLESITFP